LSPVPTKKYRPVVLVILDGWGIAAPSAANVISQSRTPVMNRIEKEFFSTTLQASGEAVGLDWGEMGNSEVGHMNMGAGVTVYQDIVRINEAIREGSFFQNPAFLGAIEHVKKNDSSLHIMGLVSNGKVHSYNEHLYALIDLAKDQGISKLYIHAFLDGRDTLPRSAQGFIAELEQKIKNAGIGQIVTLAGRYFAMDRDNRWERIQDTYDAMVFGKGKKYSSAGEAIDDAYRKGVADEHMPPVVIDSPQVPFQGIKDKDAVIFFNYRSDRAREISQAILLPGFEHFDRQGGLRDIYFAAMTDYGANLPYHVAFPPQNIENPFAKIISDRGFTQLHAAETEKFAHVTSFFDGGHTQPFPGEEFLLVHSRRDVASYDQAPKMSALALTDQLIEKISSGKFDFVVVNYANTDMVGHTANLEACKEAVETVDSCLGRLLDVVWNQGGATVVTADHGNIDKIIDLQTGEMYKEHTANPVPFVVVAEGYEQKNYQSPQVQTGFIPGVPCGVLQDVTPTLMFLMGIEPPVFMTGKSLVS